jgi:hypothetical protein
MPHFECAACKALLHSAATPADLISNVCPECGFAFEPAGEDVEIVLTRSGSSADRVGHLIARREIVRAQARVAAERWADGGGRVAGAL